MDERISTLIADPQSLNFYAYSRNNPINFVDPSGEFAFLAAIPTAYYIYAAVLAASANYIYQMSQVYNGPSTTIIDNTPPAIEQHTVYTFPQEQIASGLTTTVTGTSADTSPYITVPYSGDKGSVMTSTGISYGDLYAGSTYRDKLTNGEQRTRYGGYEQAMNDFLGLVGDGKINQQVVNGRVIDTYTFENGESVSLRDFSSGDDLPTIQYEHSDGTRIKFRYED